jgi:hypothetical protein
MVSFLATFLNIRKLVITYVSLRANFLLVAYVLFVTYVSLVANVLSVDFVSFVTNV